MEETFREFRDIKIVLIGEERVGKTNIISRMMDNQFEYSYKSTQAAIISQKRMVLKNYSYSFRVNIWDTSGQERFRSLNKIFSLRFIFTVYLFTFIQSSSNILQHTSY